MMSINHHCVRWGKSWLFELLYYVDSGCLRCTLWVTLRDFNLKLKGLNRNTIIAKLKSPDGASFEYLRLTFKNPVITCDMTSYLAGSLISISRIPLAQCIFQSTLCETLGP